MKKKQNQIKHYKLMPHCKSNWPLSIAYYAPFPCYEPLHDHDCYEIMIVLNGTGWCGVANRRYPVLPGIVFLIPPGETHEYQIPLGTLIFNIMFSKEIFSEEGKNLLSRFHSGAVAQCPEEELERLKNDLQRIDRELTEQRTGYQCLTAAVMSELLVVISRRNWVESGHIPAGAPDQLNTIISYIFTHYREPVTLTTLGKLVNWNPSYVGQFFKRYTWKTPSQYLQEIRISKARKLLENTSWPVSRIAAETGFFDAAHFSHTFRSITGMTPREYLKLLSGKLPDETRK